MLLMGFMKRAAIGIVLFALLGGVVVGLLRLRTDAVAGAVPEQDIIRTAQATRGSLEISVASSGNVAFNRTLDLSLNTAGTVQEVKIVVGERVRAGQVLLQLDNEALVDAIRQAELDLAQVELTLETLRAPTDEQRLAQARLTMQEAAQAMTVARASEALAEARAGLDQARAQRFADDAEQAYERYLDTLDSFGVPQAFAAGITATYMEAQGNVGITQLRSEYAIQQAQSQWSAAYQRYEQARNTLAALEEGAVADQIRSAELQRELAQLGLEQAQADLATAVLTAPLDGVVKAVNAQSGTAAPTGVPVVTLLDDSALYVDLAVDEIDIGGVQEGQSVRVVLDAYPGRTLRGRVDQVGLLPQSVGGVITYQVRVELTELAEADVREGMTATATITTGRLEDVILIPNWAVRTDQTTDQVFTYCYCLDNGDLEPITIEIGARSENWTEVRSGIDDGMVVALVAETRNLLELQGPPSRGQ